MARATPGLFLGSVVLALLAGCPPRTVIVDGKEIPVAEAASMAYEDAQKALEAGRTDEAIAQFEKFVKEFPEHEKIDEALLALGNLHAQAERFERAIEHYRALVAEHPQSPHYVNAAVQLGLCLVKAGRNQEAMPTLQSVFDRLPSNQKKVEVAGMLADSYSRGGAPVEALRWYSILFQLTEGAKERETLREQVVDLIDRRMSSLDVRKSLELLKASGAAGFPLDLLQFKLAKILYHILEFADAREALEAFVASFPDHALSKDAGALLKKIIDRNKVNPQAIGVLLPLSGEYRDYGQRAMAGIQLGAGIFDEAKEGEGGQGPLLVIRDTAGDPDRAVKQMEDLIFNEHVVAVIGPMVAKEAYSAAVKAQELEVPIITLSARKEITQVGNWVFRNFLTLEAQAKLLVSHAMDRLGVKRFALLYPNDFYGVEFTNAFWNEIDRRKGEVRAAEHYEPDAKTFADCVRRMVGRFYLEARYDFIQERARIRREYKNPVVRNREMERLYKSLPPIVDFEAIFVPDYVDKVVLVAPALAFEDIVLQTESKWQQDRIKKSLGKHKLDMVYLFGGSGWNSPKVIEWAKRYVEGAIFCDGFFLDSRRAATKLFVGKYKANFGNREPTVVEAEAYDTARIVKTIVEKAKPADRAAFRQALLSTKDFPGATGETSFQPDGEADKRLFLLTIKKEQIIEVEPEPGPATNAGAG